MEWDRLHPRLVDRNSLSEVWQAACGRSKSDSTFDTGAACQLGCRNAFTVRL